MNRAERRAQAARDRLASRALRRLNAVDSYVPVPFSPPRKRDIGREALDAFKRGQLTRDQAKLLGAFVSRKQAVAP